MTDTNTTLTPASAMTSGAVGVTASAALFAATDVGRSIAIMSTAPGRSAATAYAVGQVFVSSYAGIDRLYRVVSAGTTAAAAMAGTTPNYDLASPRAIGLNVPDGTAIVRYLGAGQQAWGYGVIASYTDSTHVTVTVDPRAPFVSTSPSLRWKLGEFSDARGWPAAVTFHLGRLWFGGTTTKPQTVWASCSNDFENMTPTEPDNTVLDTSAITISLDDDQMNTTRWMASASTGLAVGTSSGEFLIAPANNLAALSPSNIRAVRKTDRGSDASAPQLRLNGAILFVQRGGRKLRELEYDLATDGFSTLDLTQLADHISGSGIVEIGFAALPDGVVWALRSDGSIGTLTYDKEQSVRAWSRQVLGGTDTVVESLCVVPSPDGATDEISLAVARTINGATKRTMEYIRAPYRTDLDGATGAFQVDCGLTYSGTPAGVFSGLGHLEGQTVRIIGDGARRNDQVVTAGSVSATGPASSLVHIGLPYQHRIVSLPPEVPGDEGTSQGRLKRISEITLRFLETAGGVFGRDGQTEPIVLRTLALPMTTAVPLLTGDKRVSFPAGWDRSAQVLIEGDDGLPMTLLALISDTQTNG